MRASLTWPAAATLGTLATLLIALASCSSEYAFNPNGWLESTVRVVGSWFPVPWAGITIVVGVALLMGFRSGAGVLAWLGVAGILTLFTLALTWLAVIPGLTAKTVDGASAFSYPLIFLPFVSSAFVPTDTMPGPVRWFAENQPVTSIVDSIRALLAGEPVGGDLWIALAWCVGILVVAYVVAMVVYRRRIS